MKGQDRQVLRKAAAAPRRPDTPGVKTAGTPTASPTPAAPSAIDPSSSVSLRRFGARASVGEFFQYTVGDVSLPRQKSAMIPIITDTVKTTRLSIYNANVLSRSPTAWCSAHQHDRQASAARPDHRPRRRGLCRRCHHRRPAQSPKPPAELWHRSESPHSQQRTDPDQHAGHRQADQRRAGIDAQGRLPPGLCRPEQGEIRPHAAGRTPQAK